MDEIEGIVTLTYEDKRELPASLVHISFVTDIYKYNDVLIYVLNTDELVKSIKKVYDISSMLLNEHNSREEKC